MGDVRDFGAESVRNLEAPQPVKDVLSEIQRDVADAYREGFIKLTEELSEQRSMLARIQETLHILVQQSSPKLKGDAPAAFRVAPDGERPDLASAIVVADPIGKGYSLSQRDVAEALNLTTGTASELIKAFKLDSDPACAVTVRQGKHRIVNYNRQAIAELARRIAASTGKDFTQSQKSALRRAKNSGGLPET